jgi:hypothetical protein
LPSNKQQILDELVALAGDHTPNTSVEEGVRKIEEGLAIIKKIIY